ncbi:ankyrin repeat domain-containing protein 26-like [Moschus berezovskii]|uniref:ankyrin repeat domain-containing protein 26-like n=1 Tax=Moschus berezovskii TaxID=68408 RepID=UPI00244497B5|nr:ankyrin repeat domain-containing protein 26-like [Moschus berezovskii]
MLQQYEIADVWPGGHDLRFSQSSEHGSFSSRWLNRNVLSGWRNGPKWEYCNRQKNQKPKNTCHLRSEAEDEKRRETVCLIGCRPQVKLRIQFQELRYSFLDFLGGPHVKTVQCMCVVGVKDSVPNETVGMKDPQTSNSDLSAELDLEMISEEAQEKLDGDEKNHSQVQEEKHKSSEVEVSDSECDAAESGLNPQRKSGGNSSQEFPAPESEDFSVSTFNISSDPGMHRKKVKEKNHDKRTPEDCVIAPIFEKTDSPTGGLLHVNDESKVNQDDDRPARKTSYEKKKVKEQMNYVNNLDDFTQSSETVSEDGGVLYSTSSMLQVDPLDMGCKDSGSLLKIRDAGFSYERLVDFQRSHCELLRRKIHKMKSEVHGVQKELSETKEVKSQLEHQKVEWKRELGSLRFTLKQEEENRRNASMLYEKMREELRRKEDEYSKEIEMKQQLEFTIQALKMELKTVRINWNQVSDSCEEAKDLLRENHMLQNEIAMLRLERDALKNQNHREKEEEYFEDVEILKGKNDDLQTAIKPSEGTSAETLAQSPGRLHALRAESPVLNAQLEEEKEGEQRLETEVESSRSRLAAALHGHDQGQTSKRDLELAFQRARDKSLRLLDKLKSDMANLKDSYEMLSQQLSSAESKFNKLKIKLHHTRDDLREKTLMLERVQRDLSQAECQKQEIEHMYQNEKGKVNTYLGKHKSLEERVSQLQSENTLLQQQLDDARNRADREEKTVISIRDQFQQIVRKFQPENEKRGLMLEERNKELIKEWNHLKERLYQYENEKAEREAVVRQLQQELDDTLKKQSMSEASLKVTSQYCAHLEAEAQDLKNNVKLLQLHQLTSQTQAGSPQMELRIT